MNSSLFLKSAFPRAPLQNGLGRYVCQLQRITFKFCKSSGSSRGIREFIENGLIDFAKANPGIVVYVKPRRHRGPVMIGEYLNGTREWFNLRNCTKENLIKWIELLRGQNGPTSSYRFRKLWHTDAPSIQGVWTPFTLKHPESNLAIFPNETLSQPLDVEKSATEQLIEIFQSHSIKNKVNGEELTG